MYHRVHAAYCQCPAVTPEGSVKEDKIRTSMYCMGETINLLRTRRSTRYRYHTWHYCLQYIGRDGTERDAPDVRLGTAIQPSPVIIDEILLRAIQIAILLLSYTRNGPISVFRCFYY